MFDFGFVVFLLRKLKSAQENEVTNDFPSVMQESF
ncbi:hypothetical protein SLEP1_g55108 [Rubroshorea leprosula]|uniref:Uncharacterized protein n=1 Tax=Rubroshorea leprosula TaxID=152421 RepID=A0AAV5MGK4_9ROSI|nr:hypothetical protein SLEP1_g55108 [Rubroshorea leprosula]